MIKDRSQALVPTASRTRLRLRHPMFRTFTDPYFRLSDPERHPVFVIQLDDREACLPIKALMVEFGIGAQDDDGRMLALVIRALDFVTGMRIGDTLPLEVLTGQASWTVESTHRDLAVNRLNMHLLGLAAPGDSVADKTAASMPTFSEAELTAGLQRLSQRIGHLSPLAVLQEMEKLADELAYIEALRGWLLHGAIRMDRVLTRLARGFSGDHTHKEILGQIRRLTGQGILEIEAAFALIDGAVADLATAVTDPAATMAVLRTQRDTLYRRWRAWEPYCKEWGMQGMRHDTRTWQLAHETYRFLAPRYMTVVEWRTTQQKSEADPASRHGMTW